MFVNLFKKILKPFAICFLVGLGGAVGWSLVVFIGTGEEATDLGAAIAGIVGVVIALWLLFKKRF